MFVHKSSIQEMSFSADFEEENLDLELRELPLVQENERGKKGLFWSKMQPKICSKQKYIKNKATLDTNSANSSNQKTYRASMNHLKTVRQQGQISFSVCSSYIRVLFIYTLMEADRSRCREDVDSLNCTL